REPETKPDAQHMLAEFDIIGDWSVGKAQGAEICVKILDLGAGVRGKWNFNAAACGPAGSDLALGVPAAGNIAAGEYIANVGRHRGAGPGGNLGESSTAGRVEQQPSDVNDSVNVHAHARPGGSKPMTRCGDILRGTSRQRGAKSRLLR